MVRNRYDTLVILFWRHILLVVWKCLILCQIIIICGKCWFSSSIRRKWRPKSIKSSKNFSRCCSKWNNVPWLVLSLQRRRFRCWRPSAWRKAKNLRRRWCYLLWADENERNHHWGTVSNAIDVFVPSTAWKTATIRAEARKSDTTAWQPSASLCQTRQSLPGNAQTGSPTPPAVFPRYCAVRLILVLVDGTWFRWWAVPLIWIHRKMA